MFLEQPWLLVSAATIFLLAVYRSAVKRQGSSHPASKLPWVGLQKGIFSKFRGRIASLTNLIGPIKDGYEKYSINGGSFFIPTLFGSDEVIVPQTDIKWIIDQPDHVLSALDMQRESLQADFSFLDPSMVRHPIHEKTTRKELTRKLGTLIPDVVEELADSIDELWGVDASNWNDVTVFGSMMNIVSRASNRAFVGLPLCRNDDYLDNARKFARDIPLTSAVFKLFPRFMRPLVQWVISLPTAWHCYKCFGYLVPLIKIRMADNEKRARGETKEPAPNDFLSWHIQSLDEEPDQSEKIPKKIARRMMVINFAAIHTSTFAATNILFDIFSTAPEERVVEQLREEVERVLSQHGGQWSKESLAKLVKIDSAIRESIRTSTFMIKGLQRMVRDPLGVTLQNGVHLPQGSVIGAPVYSIHHDNANYENAMKYEAFRFSSAREDSSVLEGKNLSIVTTDDTYLTFGHGRHACPGRFFAAAELKLLLAYIILNYDVKPLITRPPNSVMGSHIIPPTTTKIQVKRRSG